MSRDHKQRARARRERKFRRRITTLSWTLPAFAFGSFFTIWHTVSAAVNVPAKAKQHVSTVTNHSNDNTTVSVKPQPAKSVVPSVLFKVGSTGQQVSAIQEQLASLGYFTHAITEYYGLVTEQAVRSFQTAKHLNPTGEIDSATLTTLQQAAKGHRASSLATTQTSTAPSVSNSKPVVRKSSTHTPPTNSASTSKVPQNTQTTHQASTPAPTTSSASVSQQSTPQTSSSAS